MKHGYWIEGRRLTQHDRRVIALWSGQDVPRFGDVTIELNAEERENFHGLLAMLQIRKD